MGFGYGMNNGDLENIEGYIYIYMSSMKSLSCLMISHPQFDLSII